MLADPAVDSVIAIYIPVLATEASAVAAAIQSSAATAEGKTLLATFMSAAGSPAPLTPVPAFPFPERAVQALAAATRYGAWREMPAGEAVHIDDVDRGRLRAIVEAGLARGGGWLDPMEVADTLAALRIEAPQTLLVHSADGAMEAAMRIGFPVALKAYGPELLHKSDVAGVTLSLRQECGVFDAYTQLASSLGDRMTGAVVQEMAADGVEMMVGIAHDRVFGNVVAMGAGGTLVELLNDVAFRLHPLSGNDPEAMLHELRCETLLRGFRGSKPVDVAGLRDAVLRVSALLDVCPEIRELDVNPLLVCGTGVMAVDARIRVEAVPAPTPSRRVAY